MRYIKKACAVAVALAMAFPAMCLVNVSDAQVHGTGLSGMENYPGVKHFNFASKEVRGNVNEECMIDPEYSIKMEKTMPDEYFGAKTTTRTDDSIGETITGFALGGVSARNACGGICHNMFMYKGNWIDVKTTYVDWDALSRLSSFFGGGFTRQRWRSMGWVEMKHEFFLAGTDTPVVIKGFQNYADIDDSQGIMLEKNKLEDIWINSSNTMLAYDEIPAGTEYVLDNGETYTPQRDMVYIQTTTTEDIPEEGTAGYNGETAARCCMGFTFSASVLYTGIVDGGASGLNILESGNYKFIPSALPQQGTPLIAKKVADNDEEKGESNSVIPGEEWTYYVNAFVPEETESYNFYESFTIEDTVNGHLNIENVRIMRGEENVTELFTLTEEENSIFAKAIDVSTRDFYGYDYVMEVTVSLKTDKETLKENSLIDDECCFTVPNIAKAVYGTGTEEKEIPTNETTTVIRFEKEADIAITKEIQNSDVYEPHGEISFVFNLKGTTSNGEEREYNRYISFPEEYVRENSSQNGTVSRTVIFKDIPEGEYTCSEYETMRFGISDIKAMTGGTKNENTVIFNIDSTDTCRATFVNEKKNWADYSHSSLVVNKLGQRD